MTSAPEKFLTRDDILHLSEAERMMKLEMYTGSKKQKPREEWWYHFVDGTIQKGIITWDEACKVARIKVDKQLHKRQEE